MKRVLMTVGLFFGSLLLVAELALLGVAVKPDLFGIGASDQPVKPVTRQSMAETDTTVTAVPNNPVPPEGGDTSVVQQNGMALDHSPSDSVHSLTTASPEDRQVIEHVNESARMGVTREDSIRAVNRQVLAKMMDSMDAADAARILRQLSDNEARDVLIRIKRRQAGKILSALDPDRAANMMR